MKKIKFSKQELAQLSIGQRELMQIKGGYVDSQNTNEVLNCSCSYNNKSIDINTNREMGCRCLCV